MADTMPNLHEYSIKVVAFDNTLLLRASRSQLPSSSSSSHHLFIDCQVSMIYKPFDTPPGVIETFHDFMSEKSFEFPPRPLKSDDVLKLFSDLDIPFPMKEENLYWGLGEACAKLDTKNDLVERIVDLTQGMVNQHGCHSSLKINLKIVKTNHISSAEFDAKYWTNDTLEEDEEEEE